MGDVSDSELNAGGGGKMGSGILAFNTSIQSVGCSEKLKNAKSNYGYSYFMTPWYIETEKTQFFEF